MRGWPNQRRSKAAGCTCQWWGCSIAQFDPKCVILRLHRCVPAEVYAARYTR